LEVNAASPGDQTFVVQATILLMFGFAALLAVVPFHSWVPNLAEHAPPLPTAFAFTVMPLAVLFLLLSFLDNYTWLGGNPIIYRALIVAGGAMVLIGTLFVFGQRNFGRSMGYLMLVDFGAVMLGVGLGTKAGVQAALVTVALRGLALPLWAIGLDQLRRVAGSDHFDALEGFGRRYPVAAAAVVLGMLSVAGFPLTAGFVGRWALLHQLVLIYPTAAILLLLATVSAGLVCARGLAVMLSPPPVANPGDADHAVEPPSRLTVTLYGVGFAVVLVLGVFPQWLLPLVGLTAEVFTLHIR
jgi:NADH-quinone oxidoreductase subunit N